MRTILVTGGAGFIGSHLTEKLLQIGNRVIVFDNLVTSKKIDIPKSAIFVKGDVRSKIQLERTFKTYQPNVVFHIAGLASNINSFTDPYSDAEVNYFGTVNVTRACVASQTPRLVYASSMMIYGDSVLEMTESSPAIPTSYYGISKYAAERFVQATAVRPDLPAPLFATSLRMFNVYGPGQRLDNPYQGVLAIFIGNVLRGEPIKIFGTGHQSRDFIYIDDVVDAWVHVIDDKQSYGGVFNLGSGEKVSMNSLAKMVITACGKNPKTYPVVHGDARPGDKQSVRADMRLSNKILGHVSRVKLSDGLSRTVAWAKK